MNLELMVYVVIGVILLIEIVACFNLWDDRKKMRGEIKSLSEKLILIKVENDDLKKRLALNQPAHVLEILNQARSDGAIVEITLIDKKDIYFHQQAR